MKTTLLIASLLALTFVPGFAAGPDDPKPTYHDQPVGPSLSPDDANAYVDDVVKTWLNNNPPAVDSKAVATLLGPIRKLGVPNLISVFSQIAPDNLHRRNTPYSFKDDFKRTLVTMALSREAQSSDIPALLAVYDQRPLILKVFFDNQTWDLAPQVTAFLVKQLSPDAIKTAYQNSILAPSNLLNLAARNKSPDVIDAFNKLVTDACTNSTDYDNAYLYLEFLQANDYTKNPIILQHFGDILTVMTHRVETDQSDEYHKLSPHQVFGQLDYGRFVAQHPELFADDKVREGIQDAEKVAALGSLEDTTTEVPFAAIGDKPSLVKLAEFYDAASQGNTLITNKFEVDKVRNYLATIIVQRPGEPLTQIVKHVETAVYDKSTGLWTIPKDPNEPGADPGLITTPAAPTPAPAAIAPLTPTPAVAKPTTNAAPVTAAPTAAKPKPDAPVIAVVITATKIVSTTSNGGHAAVPLSPGTKLIVVSINPDGTLTAKTDFQFVGQLPQTCVSITNP